MSSPWNAMRTHLRSLRERDTAFRVRVVLGFVWVLLLWRVLVGDDPWNDGVAAQLAKGHGVHAEHYAETWLWWASLVNLFVVGALWATARRWLGLRSEAPGPEPSASRPSRALWAALVLCVGLAAGLGGARLGQSLWDDELYTLRNSVHGKWKESDGELRFQRTSWADTFWDYRMPNNHVPNSVLARLSAGGWRLATGESRQRIPPEWTLRAPAFVAALAGVVALALLVRRVGGGGAAALAALLLVLHPWFTRFSSEARGYGFLFLLIPLYASFFLRVIQRGAWRDFIGLGVLQLLLLWTWPGSLAIVAVANGLLLLSAWWSGARETLVVRQLVVGGLGAAAFLQLMLPVWPQLQAYSAGSLQGELGLRWLRNYASHLWIGTPWGMTKPNPPYAELSDLVAAQPAGVWLLGLATAAMLVLGAGRLLARSRAGGLLVGLLVLPLPLTYGLAVASGDAVYPWYGLFALPGALVLVAQGLARGLESSGPARMAGMLGVAAFVAGFAWLGQPARAALLERSLSPYRDSVLLTRPSLDPRDPANERILTASPSRVPSNYDPSCMLVRETKVLRSLMKRADREEMPLWINLGRIELARRDMPELLSLIEDESRFESFSIHGFEPIHSRYVFRYRGNEARAAR